MRHDMLVYFQRLLANALYLTGEGAVMQRLHRTAAALRICCANGVSGQAYADLRIFGRILGLDSRGGF